MIKFFRNLQDTWIIKLVLIITVLSFMSFFGVGGITGPSGYKGPAIKVDGIEIGAEQLEKELVREVKRFKQIYGQDFDLKQAVAFGFLGEIIKRDTSTAIADVAAQDFGISISDESVAKIVKMTTDFHDASGNFDEWRFKKMLQTSGWGENEYLETVRSDIARAYLLKAATSYNKAPSEIVKKIYAYRNEKRIAETVKINVNDIKITNKPKKSELEKFYEDKKSMFMAPEYRKISYVAITPQAVETQVKINEADVKAAYEANKASYVTPEKRFVLQMIFDNESYPENGEAQAKKAAKRINAGEKFEKVANDMLGQKKADTELGFVTKDSLLAELAVDIFKSGKNKVIGPIKSQFGWHLAMVTGVEKEIKVDYKKATKDIRAGMIRQQALDMLYDISTVLDDDLGRGTPLKEAAEKIGLEYKTIKAVDMDGKTPSGKLIDKNVRSKEFLDIAFTTYLDEESQVEEFDNGYFVVRVDDITDAAPRPLKQVKRQIIKIWKNKRKEEVAKQKAESVLSKIIAGQSPKSVAKKLGLKYQTTPAVTRFENKKVPASVAAEIFRIKKGDASMNIVSKGFVVSKLKEIIKANPSSDAKGLKAIEAKLETDIGQDLSTGLVAAFSKQYEVKIDAEVLDQAFYSRYNDENIED
jgi:peptidyl-prolyl cis-trans isomerase D